LVEDCAAAGIEMIDVQTPHDEETMLELGHPAKGTPHPCIRLGEENVPLEEFLEMMDAAWGRAFDGGIQQWIAKGREYGPGISTRGKSA
jgi:hypothetical protein